jgi:hypothetical protein
MREAQIQVVEYMETGVIPTQDSMESIFIRTQYTVNFRSLHAENICYVTSLDIQGF